MNSSNSIINSASKISFLALIITVCLAFLIEVILRSVVLEAKDFMLVVMAAAGFYFAYKPTPSTAPLDLPESITPGVK